MNIAEFHNTLNRLLAAHTEPTHVQGTLVKANRSEQRLFLEVASEGCRLQCGTTVFDEESLPRLEKGTPIKLFVRRPPKIWRNGTVGVWLLQSDMSAAQASNQLKVERDVALAHMKERGLIEKNKQLILHQCCRIALLTAKTSDAHADFTDELLRAADVLWKVDTFNVTVQGQHCLKSMQVAFAALHQKRDAYDVVVVTRGGGSPQDLAPFDTVDMATLVGECALPVITGIGHHRDESLCDIVAYRHLKTPTAAAAFLVAHTRACLAPIHHHQTYIHEAAQRALELRKQRVKSLNVQIKIYRDAWQLTRRFQVVELRNRVHTLVHHRKENRLANTCRIFHRSAEICEKKLEQCENQHVRIVIGSMVVEGVCRRC